MNAPITERKLKLRSGTEGSMFDPYGWTEYTVIENGSVVTLRQGAIGYARLSVDGKEIAEGFDAPGAFSDASEVVEQWERMTGLKADEFEDHYYRIHPYFDDPRGRGCR